MDEDELKEARASAMAAIRSGEAPKATSALVEIAFSEDDLPWAYEVVLEQVKSSDPQIRGVAILCIGHLGRIHRRLPDERGAQAVAAARSDADKDVRGKAMDALADLEVFVPEYAQVVLTSSRLDLDN